MSSAAVVDPTAAAAAVRLDVSVLLHVLWHSANGSADAFDRKSGEEVMLKLCVSHVHVMRMSCVCHAFAIVQALMLAVAGMQVELGSCRG